MNKGSLLILFSIVGLLIIVGIVLNLLLPDKLVWAKDIVGIIQLSATIVAIAVGGIFAAIRLELFRDFVPHLTIGQEISHRRIGDSYVHIGMVVTQGLVS